MIPLKVSMRNFMCYGEQVSLSFEGMHLACLCGDNGSGKTAVLDAITWALWGKARGKSDDDLIHLGQRDMEVELEFSTGGNRYRILRKRSRGIGSRPGQTILELHIESASKYKSISGNSIKETEKEIANKLLKLDYDTFINSVYLRQGRADEFARLTPDKRKQVLGNILRLERYDRLKEKAKGNVRNLEGEVKLISSTIELYGKEIRERDAWESNEKDISAQLKELENLLNIKAKQLETFRDKRVYLEAKKAELEQVKQVEVSARREVERWTNIAAGYRKKIEQYSQILGQQGEIEDAYQKLLALRKEREEIANKLKELNTLRKRHSELTPIIETERARLEAAIQNCVSRITELQRKVDLRGKKKEELEKAKKFIEEIGGEKESLEVRRNKLQESETNVQQKRTQAEQLAKQLEENREKLQLLEKETADCPLCGRELGEEDRKRLVQQYRDEMKNQAETRRNIELYIRARVRELEGEREAIKRMDNNIQERSGKAQRMAAALEKEIEQCNEADIEIRRLKEMSNSKQELLNKGQYCVPQRKELEEIIQQISKVAYDEDRYRQLVTEIGQYEHSEARRQILQEAQKLLPEQQKGLSEAEVLVSRWQAEAESLAVKLTGLIGETVELVPLIKQLEQEENIFKGLQKKIEPIKEQLSDIRAKLNHIQKLEESVRDNKKRLQMATREKDIYDELAKAFSREGIQAFIIENVLPEIENEATELLKRMTSNVMTVKLESQKPKKTERGEMAETLDIKVSDELGTRDYEMFSGGESFRINFALRVALSKLLANRAGVPLPILFIDEGFGTQDSAGLHSLVEAINSIKGDFEKIIVITHMEELKNEFPVRIDVVKTAGGSKIIAG